MALLRAPCARAVARRASAIALALALLLVAAARPGLAAPDAELWERWAAHDPASTERVDHATWNAFLDLYVRPGEDGVHRVAYAEVTAAKRRGLENYLGRLARVAVSTLNRREQFAYWVNLYNALTVFIVLDAYPVDSIREIDISPGLFSDGPWGKKMIEVEGERLSLDDIEHRILRPIWRDPRVHYLVNCAAIGCPNLQREAITAENAEAYLETAARAFVNHPRGSRVVDGRLEVSSLYDWYKEDFGGDDTGVIQHLLTYADDSLAQALAGMDEIDDDAYDWSLNDAAADPPRSPRS